MNKTVYAYDDNGVYIGETSAEMSPRENGVWLIPANATEIKPPVAKENEWAVFEEGAWVLKADYRGVVYWLLDGTEHEINEIGTTLPPDALEEKPVIEPTPDELQSKYSRLAQSMMDEKARERNYDNIASACSYTASTNQKFASEAAACVVWRDAVWEKCYELLDTVLEGLIEIPSEEDFLAMLPTFVWPNEIGGQNAA